MYKKCLLFFLLFLINACLLYGEGKTEVLVRKSNSLFRMANDKLIKLDDKAVTVKLKNGKGLSNDLKILRSNILGYIDIEVPNDIDVEDFVARLNSTGDYEIVKYNEIAEVSVSSIDPQLSYQWYLGTINMDYVWNITTGSPIVKVAVIDNGFELTHEDIGYGNDTYRNIEPTLGYDYYQMSSTSMTNKNHGTGVMGIISAKTYNGIGIAGIGGGYGYPGVKILPFCVTDGSNSGVNMGYVDDAICLAVDNGARVINMSIGTSDTILANNVDIVDAIEYAYNHGVTLVAASGNNNPYVMFPACYTKVIAVGATNQSNQKADFSSFGNGINLVAPGVGIKSTAINDSYNTASGTSFAAPQVSGVAALMLSVNPSLTNSQIRTILQNTCTKLSNYTFNNNGWNNYVGYGLLNAYKAIYAVAAHEIVGAQLIYTSRTYYVDNLQSGATVVWELSNNYYNQNCLQQNYPSTNQCTITRSDLQDMMDATLTAYIIYNGDTIQTLKKAGLYAYSDFWGYYISDNLSGNINYTHYFSVKPNTSTSIFSPNFYGGTASYNNSGTIPLYWEFYPDIGRLRFTMPSNNNNIPIIINVYDGCGNSYLLYAAPQNYYYLNVSTGDQTVIVTIDGSDASEDRGIVQPWALEIRSASTGELKIMRTETSKSASVSTSGWPKGIYIVKVTYGNEKLTEKIVLK